MAVLADDAVGTGPPAGGREQGACARRVVDVRAYPWVVGPHERRQVFRGERSGAECELPHDRAFVDRGGDRTAHADILQIGTGQVDQHIRRGVRGNEVRNDSRQRSNLPVRVDRGEDEDVELVGAQLVRQRRLVGDDPHADAFELGFPQVVGIVRDELDRLTVIPAQKLVGAGPDRRAVERRPVEIRRAPQEVFGEDGVGRTIAEQGRECRRIGSLQSKHDRVRIGRLDLRDLVVAAAVRHVVGRVHDCRKRERDVPAGERLTVVPAHVAPQMVGDRAAVLGDAAVRERRHRPRQTRHQFAVGIEPDQHVEDQPVDEFFVVAQREKRRERIGLAGHADPQHRRIGRRRRPAAARGGNQRDSERARPQRTQEHESAALRGEACASYRSGAACFAFRERKEAA